MLSSQTFFFLFVPSYAGLTVFVKMHDLPIKYSEKINVKEQNPSGIQYHRKKLAEKNIHNCIIILYESYFYILEEFVIFDKLYY